MPRTYAYTTLDVFTSTAFKGNQLGVVTVPAGSPLTEGEKLSIAQEFNYSETIFVHEPGSSSTSQTSSTTTTSTPPSSSSPSSSSSPPPKIKVDIFTTESELPFAGHPTIGAIHHALTSVFGSPTSSSSDDHTSQNKGTKTTAVTIALKAGLVQGTLDHDTGFTSAEIPHDFHIHTRRQLAWSDVVAVQPWLAGPDNDSDNNSVIPVALVSIVQGLNFALIDLTATPSLLGRVGVTRDNVATVKDLDDGWSGTLFGNVFFVVRPQDRVGHDDDSGSNGNNKVTRIDQRVVVIGLEDPATGSASCALTAYLALRHGGPAERVHRFELVQGEQMGRKSVIAIQVTLDPSGTAIEKMVMSGQCRAVMKGELQF